MAPPFVFCMMRCELCVLNAREGARGRLRFGAACLLAPIPCSPHGAHWHLPVGVWVVSSYLVDPASSHMLVSKIKPCMS